MNYEVKKKERQLETRKETRYEDTNAKKASRGGRKNSSK